MDGAWLRSGRSTADPNDALLIHRHFSHGFDVSLFCHHPVHQTKVPAEAQAAPLKTQRLDRLYLT